MSSGTDILKLFYEESNKWSFSFENLVQLSRLRSLYEARNYIKLKKCYVDSIKKKNNSIKFFLERSIMSSYNVFAKNSFEENRLNDIEFNILTKYYSFFTQKANMIGGSNDASNTEKMIMSINKIPYQIIYIRTTPDVCFQRLLKRSRDSENNIDLEYLKKIHLKYENWIESIRCENNNNVKIIDGNQNKSYVIEKIKQIIQS
jgi:deoxyadenosine/deoxycytidine kinase